MSVNIVTDTELTVCISLSLSPGPNQLQCLLPSCCRAHSTLVTGQTRISGPEKRERDGHPTRTHLTLRVSDDLNISQQSRSRAAEREIRRKLSLSFFARVISNFLFCLKTSLPPFFL